MAQSEAVGQTRNYHSPGSTSWFSTSGLTKKSHFSTTQVYFPSAVFSSHQSWPKFWIKNVYTTLRKLMIVIADQTSSHQLCWLLGNLLKVRWIRLAFLKFERLKVKAMMTRRWPQIFHFGEVYNPKLSSQIMTIILLPVLIQITIHSQATTTVAM